MDLASALGDDGFRLIVIVNSHGSPSHNRALIEAGEYFRDVVTRRVVFRPQAENDALEVRQWYEARREGLGAEFGIAVDELVERIEANPLAFQRAHLETR